MQEQGSQQINGMLRSSMLKPRILNHVQSKRSPNLRFLLVFRTRCSGTKVRRTHRRAKNTVKRTSSQSNARTRPITFLVVLSTCFWQQKFNGNRAKTTANARNGSHTLVCKKKHVNKCCLGTSKKCPCAKTTGIVIKKVTALPQPRLRTMPGSASPKPSALTPNPKPQTQA